MLKDLVTVALCYATGVAFVVALFALPMFIRDEI